MTISTYAELQTAVANWIVRADVAARIPEFIALGESRLNRLIRKRQVEVSVALTGVANSRFIMLPAAYTEAIFCQILPASAIDWQEMRRIDAANLPPQGSPGQPYWWAIDGTNLAFERPCDQAYAFTLRCLEKFALSDAAPTNSLLTDYPDAYLFAALAEAGPFLRDAAFTSTFEQKLDNAIAEIRTKERRATSRGRLYTEIATLIRGRRNSGYDIRTDN